MILIIDGTLDLPKAVNILRSMGLHSIETNHVFPIISFLVRDPETDELSIQTVRQDNTVMMILNNALY